MALVVKNPADNAGDHKDTGSISGLRRSPGGGHGNPLQYSFLENPMDRGAWQAMVRRVAKSWTWLKQLSTSNKHGINPWLPSFIGIHSFSWKSPEGSRWMKMWSQESMPEKRQAGQTNILMPEKSRPPGTPNKFWGGHQKPNNAIWGEGVRRWPGQWVHWGELAYTPGAEAGRLLLADLVALCVC